MLDLPDALRHLVVFVADRHQPVLAVTIILLAWEATFGVWLERAGAIVVSTFVVTIAYAFVAALVGCTSAGTAFVVAGIFSLVVILARKGRALEGARTRWMWALPSAVAIGVAWWLFQQCYRAAS